MAERRKPIYVKLIGWWYLCLGLAFASLAWRNALLGLSRIGIVLRLIVGAGFALLGILTLRAASRKPGGGA